MKSGLAILTAILLLGSGMQISVDHHYCGGSLADTKISLAGKMASCGMEDSETNHTEYPIINKKCCEDKFATCSIHSNYIPEFNKNKFCTSGKANIIYQPSNLFEHKLFAYNQVKWVLPPGENAEIRLSQPEICVFRI